MSEKAVIVFGGSGLLGSSLIPKLYSAGYYVVVQSRKKGSNLCIDPYDELKVTDALLTYKPVAIVNLIACTDVDRCEIDIGEAFHSNIKVIEIISKSISKLRNEFIELPHLVQISTDQVYSGKGPHSENRVNPINVYGLSKYVGETIADKVEASIIRSNFFGRSHCQGRQSFTDWLVHNMRQKTPITVFCDIKFSPVHLETLCNVIINCIRNRYNGTLNMGSSDSITKSDFALCLAKYLNLSTEFVRVGYSTDLNLKACRPNDMTLDISKIEKSLNIKCPSVIEQIEYAAKEYKND